MREFVAVLLAIVILSAPMCSVVFGSEQLPWGVERIRPYCVWDNDNWNMTKWNMTGAWDVDLGANAGQNVTVAVIDTGMDYTIDSNNSIHVHPDLVANVKGMAGCFYNLSTHAVDMYTDPVKDELFIRDYLFGHGTEVAGVIAAAINGIGVIGTAPNVSLYSLKLYSLINPRANYEQEEEAATAIDYAVDNLGAKVISMSVGWSVDNQDLNSSCTYAFNHGALLIAAAGDFNATDLGHPADYFPYVVAVGSVDHNDTRAVFPYPYIASNYGPLLQFMAPGVDINTTGLNGGYTLTYGTSFSAPFVSATAALVFASKVDPYFDFHGGGADGFWENDEVWAKMVLNGKLDLGPLGKDNDTGWGLVNAWMANQRPLGDVNNDHKTDIKDVLTVAKAYGSIPGDWNWDPRADIDINKKVDIKDMLLVQKHYGEVDP